MRFENQSSKLLSITKSKAKMHEFGLDEEHHIRLIESPTKLLLMTIGILGDLCREELSLVQNFEIYEKSKSELRNVAKYFDALISSKLQPDYDYYLCLLGAASYYLADMPGSSFVLTRKLETLGPKFSTQKNGSVKLDLPLGYVELMASLEWALVADFTSSSIKSILVPFESNRSVSSKFRLKIEYCIKVFYVQNIDLTKIINKYLLRFREYIYSNGTDRELFLVDVFTVVIKRKLESSAMKLLPKYSKLPIGKWFAALNRSNFIQEFWPAQKLLGEAGIFHGKSAVIQLPTSAGKTKSAELIIRSSFLSGRASVAVIIAPFRSLCREISSSMSIAFSDENVFVNQLNDVPQIDYFDLELFSRLFGKEDISGSPTIVIATPEKLVYLLRHQPELAGAISLVIYDEGHQFDTGARGVTYELLLTSLKRELREQTQHVLISAVLSNAESIGDWLYAGEGSVVNGAECLSTERSIAFASWRNGRGQFHYVEPFDIDVEQFFVPRVMESLKLPKKDTQTVQRYFPPKDDKSLVAAYLGIKLSEHGPVAVFCGQKSSVIKICREVLEPLEIIEQLDDPIRFSDQDEIQKIGKLSELHLGSSSVVTKAIKRGVLPHSANIPNGLRISVEHAMEYGYGRCVVCTSTLAQGVNLPIKYLVVSGVFQGEKLISTRDFHNLLGRAGRAGKHTEGSIIFADTELFDNRRTSKRRQWSQINNLLDPSQSESCLSSLLTLVQPFVDDPFNIDPIKQLQSPEKYEKLSIQAAELRGIQLTSLLKQMRQRVGYIESLESYLLANLTSDEMLDGKDLTELCQETFAYRLASDTEKDKLVQVFKMVAERVKQIEVEKRPCFGKALLGINKLEFLETWLLENIEALDEGSDVLATLESLWPVIDNLSMNNSLGKLIGENAPLLVAKQWCSGVSYNEILLQTKRADFKFRAGSQQRSLKIENITDICDGALGYDAMLIVGACADLIESLFGKPLLADSIRDLQLALRIGLSDNIAKELYAIGLADRAVALAVSDCIAKSGKEVSEYGKSLAVTHREAIEPELHKFPSVFFNSLYGNS
ncbi:DEAD/DEAH box helicase [Shewanella vaxholmensis]|uniref:DEAD/DEAH box helicase n=1 Tax=Shewanella vaxholmensis TaxID=3063535 RepID=A0ABU9UXP0_9GAMM